MELKERIAKFDKFLTDYANASGATGLCEAVRSAMKVCFEGLDTSAPWMDPASIDPKYKNNVVAGYGELRRRMAKDIPLAKYRARVKARKAIPANDPVGTDAPVDECASKAEK
jgi:hypothetical protein